MLFCCVQLEWTPHQLDFREKKLLWNSSLTNDICLLSVQVRVRLQLPLFSQSAGELGRGEEAGGEGATARSPQICAAPQHRQGTCRHQCLHHSCSLWPSALPGRISFKLKLLKEGKILLKHESLKRLISQSWKCYSIQFPARCFLTQRNVSSFLLDIFACSRPTRARTWSPCPTPQPQRPCAATRPSGWSQKLFSQAHATVR